MTAPIPCRIRGVLYPSMTAAARALGITLGAIWFAVENGREETVGLGARGGHPGVETWVGARSFPSRRAAAKAEGVTTAAMCMRLRRTGHAGLLE